MTRVRLVALALLGAMLASGCSADSEPTGQDAAAEETTSSSEPTPQPGGGGKTIDAAEVPETLDFDATTVSGDPFEGASLAGRPTLLWFWAPWCPTCRSQIPQVEGFATTYDGELNVIGVGSLDSADAIAEFADDVEGVTHLEDSEGELFKRFEIAEQSSFVLLDADGSVVVKVGYGGSDDLDQQVEDVLG